MARFFTLIVAVWTLLLSAPLCVSGVAAHPCEPCAQTCSHEAACPQDPCSLQISPSETTTSLVSCAHVEALPLFHVSLPPVVLACAWQESTLLGATRLSRNAQPYPIGAFPLLI